MEQSNDNVYGFTHIASTHTQKSSLHISSTHTYTRTHVHHTTSQSVQRTSTRGDSRPPHSTALSTPWPHSTGSHLISFLSVRTMRATCAMSAHHPHAQSPLCATTCEFPPTPRHHHYHSSAPRIICCSRAVHRAAAERSPGATCALPEARLVRQLVEASVVIG